MHVNPESVTVLVVDDEEPARNRLTDLLAEEAGIGRLLEAADGEQAVQIIRTEAPDLVLLDVQMPGLDGFGVIDAIGPSSMPLTVFVTAYNQHAIRAFEATALDYILKPYSDARLSSALSRTRERLRQIHMEQFCQGLEALMITRTPMAQYRDRVAIRTPDDIRILSVNQIESIEAAGTYVTLHSAIGSFLHREPLASLLRQLDPQRFVRIHRSTVVNVTKIAKLQALSHGEYDATMKDGRRFRVSRTYRSLLESCFVGVL